jgi:glycosyltransferase involved in cell wall biosynthesis
MHVRTKNLESVALHRLDEEETNNAFGGKRNGSGIGRPLRILQVGTFDVGGGAEKVAWDLFRSYRAQGHSSWLAVGNKRGDDPAVVQIPKRNGSWSRVWLDLEKRLEPFDENNRRLISRTRTALRMLAQPRHELGSRFGLEDFDYPGTKKLLQLVPHKPDVIHCHNLHGGYFDLRAIPWLSRQMPLVLTLHDAWLLAGHCAHSFACERWKIGCGQCPDLTIYPAIGRDATAYNWRRKKNIFSRSRIYVSTPSEWLMRKVEQSLLRPSIAETRVIPNGVDLAVFRPAGKRAARRALGISQDVAVVLFTAYQPQTNIYKDYKTLRAAMVRIAQSMQRDVLFLALGGEAATEHVGNVEVLSVPYQSDPKVVAEYYRAADLYVHASRIDTFPCSVLEALACGTPVVATEVGGIPEQIKGLRGMITASVASSRYDPNHATGVLVPAGDPELMAESIRRLLNDDPLRGQIAENASKDARYRFALEDQAQLYINWYEELIRDAVLHNPRLRAGSLIAK